VSVEAGALTAQVTGLLDQALTALGPGPDQQALQEVRDSLGEPLRVAIAGKVKAGKSTLLNALVGEQLAPTDEGECTKIVTWYRNGHTYRIELDPKEGEPRQIPFTRDDEAIEIDLGGADPESVERLVVDWPSPQLERITLIDTPGIASLSTDVSARATAFLTPEDDRPTAADAVLYLMKHVHAGDLGFLEAFHDEEVSQATPVNAIAVLSRADEVAVGRLDAMESARAIAARYRTDPKLRKLAQTVVPVAGLLAESGSTLRQIEYQALESLARVPVDERRGLLLSADRFVSGDTTAGLTSMEREALLGRFGLFGIRLAVHLIAEGTVSSASDLADRLVAESGLPGLRSALLSQFAERRDVLKARTGLLALEAVVKRLPPDVAAELGAEVERVTASAHDFNELRLLNSIRTGAVTIKEKDLSDVEHLLGTSGTSASARLGLPTGASDGEIAQAAQASMARWQQRAESPMTAPDLAGAYRVLVRTCEGILTDLAGG
jgi:predicted GTPase